MLTDDPGIAPGRLHTDAQPELKEVVMGLHWDPPSEGGTGAPLGDVTPETDAAPALDGAAPDLRTFASRKREPRSLLAGAPSEGAPAQPKNLDAMCVLLDSGQQVVEIIHPGRPRNANGSVVHTGDAQTGASVWDDERIFVFLEALPENISILAFIVASATGHAFDEVRGAFCHISDHATDYRWVGVELTALGAKTTHCVGVLCRGPAGWKVSPDAQPLDRERLAELLSLAASVKRQ